MNYFQQSMSSPLARISSRIKRRDVVATLNEEPDVIDYVQCDPSEDDDYAAAEQLRLAGAIAQTSTPIKNAPQQYVNVRAERGSTTETDSIQGGEAFYTVVDRNLSLLMVFQFVLCMTISRSLS